MKKVLYLLFVLLGLSLLFVSCSQSVAPSQAEIDNAVAKADAQTQKVVDLLADDDDQGLSSYLDTVDPGGDVAALVDAYKTSMTTAGSKAVAEDIPAFNTDAYANGDVLVFKGDSSSWQAQLMSLVLKGNFGHAGVLDKGLAESFNNNACVLSATIAQDPETGEWINGLCMQDQSELMVGLENLGRFSVDVNTDEITIPAALLSMEDRIANVPSLYAFLHLNLEPVSRDDDLLWYCSKVPWRFYNDNYGQNIEDADFYFGDDNKWAAMRATTLYRVYKAFLLKILPSRWSKWAGILADRKLKRVLRELITPDELYYWAQTNSADCNLYGEPLADFWAHWPPSPSPRS